MSNEQLEVNFRLLENAFRRLVNEFAQVKADLMLAHSQIEALQQSLEEKEKEGKSQKQNKK